MLISALKNFRERVAQEVLLAAKQGRQRLRAVVATPARRNVLFVAGVQRSGTNMVMDVLEKNLETDVYHERDPRAFDNYKLREDAVIAALVRHSPAPTVVVKCLMESQKLARLLEIHAPARAIWVFRNYDDVVNSMLASFSKQLEQVRLLARRRIAGDWLTDDMSDETYAQVCALAEGDLDGPSAAAIQWYFRNILYFEQGLDRDPRVLLVNYDRLVTNPGPEIGRIFAFAGLAMSPRVMRGITPRSIGKQPRPVLKPAVDACCAALLARLRDRLDAEERVS